MSRKTSCFAVVALLLLFPTRLFAGGPARLCLPIDGVTADNARASEDLLTAKLKNKLLSQPGPYGRIEFHQHGDQSYMAFYIGEDVGLREVEAALQGSGVSVPRDRLRLFGHVILQIDPGKTRSNELLADLDALDHVSVAKSDNNNGLLLVTVDMPYPVMENGQTHRESVRWETFQRNELSSEPSTKREPPATSKALPSYNAFLDIVAKHHANLKDIRWSTVYACRPVGGVAVPAANESISATQSAANSTN